MKTMNSFLEKTIIQKVDAQHEYICHQDLQLLLKMFYHTAEF